MTQNCYNAWKPGHPVLVQKIFHSYSIITAIYNFHLLLPRLSLSHIRCDWNCWCNAEDSDSIVYSPNLHLFLNNWLFAVKFLWVSFISQISGFSRHKLATWVLGSQLWLSSILDEQCLLTSSVSSNNLWTERFAASYFHHLLSYVCPDMFHRFSFK